MATVYYTGAAQRVPEVRKLVISGPAVADTVTVTVTGSNKFVKHTVPTGGDTAAAVVIALLALWGSSTDGEITEITAVVDPTDSTAILFTGPADGAPITITTTKTGSVTVTDSTVTTATGPHHASNTANYSSGALPAGTDTLIFGAGPNGPKYALTALNAIALAAVRRYPEFTGQVGLTSTSPGGYPEYRTQFLELNTAILDWAQTDSDQSEQFRIKTVTTACAVTAFGTDPLRSFSPVLEVTGLVATSTVQVGGASIGLDLRSAQTGAPATINATDGTVVTGPGCTASGSVTLTSTTAELWGNFADLTVNGGGSDVTARGSAAATGATGTKVNGGILTWRSSGDPTGSGTVIEVRGGATIDFDEAPAALPTMAITASAGATINNRADRINPAGTFTITPDGCAFQDIIYNGPPNELHTIG